MNIAVVTGAFPVLSETFVTGHVIDLLSLGHQVTVFAAYLYGQNPITNEEMPQLGAEIRARVFRKPLPLERNFPLSLLTLNAIRHPKLTTVALYRMARYPSLERTLARYGPFDVIHAHFGISGIRAAGTSGSVRRCPLITTFHGYDLRVDLKEGRCLYRRLSQRGSAFIAHSEWARHVLIDLGFPASKIVKHPNGIATRRFLPTDRKGADRGRQILVLTVARLVEEKGLAHGLRAIETALRQFPGIRYRIVGEGPLRTKLQAMAYDLEIADRVEFAGPVAQPQVVDEMNRADIFFLPSVAEGLPVVCLEAHAMSLPIVATRVGGVPEAVVDGSDGLLSDSGDSESMARALVLLARSAELRRKMGICGRRRVEQHFDRSKLIRRLVHLYESLGSGRPAEPSEAWVH